MDAGARRQKCRGKNKAGEPCKKWALTGRDYCRNHGGRTPAGISHSNFRHGRHSRHFPAMWGDLDERIADPNLRSIGLDLVVLDQRMGEILERASGLKGDAAKARAFEEYRDLAETRSRLIDAESRRLERGQSAIPEVQARLLIRSVAMAVKEEVDKVDGLVLDGKAFLAALSMRFDRLMGRSRLRVIQGETAGPPAGGEGTKAS